MNAVDSIPKDVQATHRRKATRTREVGKGRGGAKFKGFSIGDFEVLGLKEGVRGEKAGRNQGPPNVAEKIIIGYFISLSR